MKIIYCFDPYRTTPSDLAIVKAIHGEEVLYYNKTPWEIIDDFEEGDVLICYSVDELVEVTDLVNQIDFVTKEYMDLYNRGIDIMFDKSTQCNSIFIKTLVSSEQSFESVLKKCILNYAIQKNYEGKYAKRHMYTAQSNGNKVGLKKGTKLVTKKSIEKKGLIKKLSKDFNGDLPDDEVVKQIGISRNSYYKYKKEIREELAQLS